MLFRDLYPASNHPQVVDSTVSHLPLIQQLIFKGQQGLDTFHITLVGCFCHPKMTGFSMRPAAAHDFETAARVAPVFFGVQKKLVLRFFCSAVMVVSRWITRGRTGKEQGMKKKDDKHMLDICGVMEFLREKLLRQQPPYHGKKKHTSAKVLSPSKIIGPHTFGANFMVKLYPLVSMSFFFVEQQGCHKLGFAIQGWNISTSRMLGCRVLIRCIQPLVGMYVFGMYANE